MENSLFGVVIQVSNLDLCRAFYRDVLGLGAPVMDSSFWVEFRLDSQSSLFLEKSEVLDTSRNSLMDILASYGYVPKKIPTDQVGFTVYRLHDPEGNPFFIAPKEEPDNE